MDARQVDLERARREAKALLRAARDGDHVATARLRAGGTDDPRSARLADAQRAVAREHGARSWPGLVAGAGGLREAFDAGELGWRAQAAYLRALAATPGVAACGVTGRDTTGPPTSFGGGAFAVRTGVRSNTENGVVADAGDVAEVLAWLDGAPAQWLVRDPDPDPALVADLRAAGARPERTAVETGAALTELDLDGPPASITDAPGPATWLAAALAGGAFDDDADFDARRRLFAVPGVTHLLASEAGRPVGVAAVHVADTTALVLHLAVVPGARRRGVGRALLRAARDRAPSVTHAVGGSTPDALAFYGRVGARVMGSPPDRVWYLPAAGPAA